MYPILNDGVTLERCRFKGETVDRYYVENRAGQKFEVSRSIYCALLHADGSKPLCLPNKGKDVLPKLKKHDIVQTSRFVKDEGVFNRFILFSINKDTQIKLRPLCQAINSRLPMLSIIIFIIGALYIKTRRVQIDSNIHWFLGIGLIVASLVFHEVAHMVAGIAYGYRITNVGILLLSIIPSGAYVAYKERKNVSRLKGAQFSLAGVEANILLAGLCLLFSQLNHSLTQTLVFIANSNILLSCVNGLIPAYGLDGEHALGALIGVKNISKATKKWVFNKNNRRKLLNKGVSGKVFFFIFSFCVLSKILFIVAYVSTSLVSILSIFLY